MNLWTVYSFRVFQSIFLLSIVERNMIREISKQYYLLTTLNLLLYHPPTINTERSQHYSLAIFQGLYTGAEVRDEF